MLGKKPQWETRAERDGNIETGIDITPLCPTYFWTALAIL
jgi:hypothetical protein